jgi:hypothetical protein
MARRPGLNLVSVITYVSEDAYAFLRKEAIEVAMKNDKQISVSKIIAQIIEEEMVRRSVRQANKQ